MADETVGQDHPHLMDVRFTSTPRVLSSTYKTGARAEFKQEEEVSFLDTEYAKKLFRFDPPEAVVHAVELKWGLDTHGATQPTLFFFKDNLGVDIVLGRSEASYLEEAGYKVGAQDTYPSFACLLS